MDTALRVARERGVSARTSQATPVPSGGPSYSLRGPFALACCLLASTRLRAFEVMFSLAGARFMACRPFGSFRLRASSVHVLTRAWRPSFHGHGPPGRPGAGSVCSYLAGHSGSLRGASRLAKKKKAGPMGRLSGRRFWKGGNRLGAFASKGEMHSHQG